MRALSCTPAGDRRHVGLTLERSWCGSVTRCVEATTPDGGEAVLKLWSRWSRGAEELAALRAWDGR
jgi:hypothetical protein